MKLPLIETFISRFTKISKIAFIALSIACFLSVLAWGNKKGINYISLILAIMFLGLGMTILLRSFVIKDFRIVGTMILKNDSIILIKENKREIYLLNQIDCLDVNYEGFEGESISFLHSEGMKRGDKNSIEIVSAGRSTICKFYMKNKEERNFLLSFLRNYKKQGITIHFKNLRGSEKL